MFWAYRPLLHLGLQKTLAAAETSYAPPFFRPRIQGVITLGAARHFGMTCLASFLQSWKRPEGHCAHHKSFENSSHKQSRISLCEFHLQIWDADLSLQVYCTEIWSPTTWVSARLNNQLRCFSIWVWHACTQMERVTYVHTRYIIQFIISEEDLMQA